MKNNNKSYVLLILLLMLMKVHSQELYQQTSIELNDYLNDGKSYSCQATSSIELLPGFGYCPKLDNDMMLEIDRYSMFPPENDTYGGCISGDDGVVASLPANFVLGNTGAAVYSIDIELPKALGVMTPKLALVYNNQSGDGLLGWSWNLSGISSIERVGKTEYHDGVTMSVDFVNDRYAVDGQRLMSVGNNEYKLEIDNMDKIISYKGTKQDPDYFVIWKRDGSVWEYGVTEDSRIEAQGDENIVFRWMLNKISDRNGNSINYTYCEDKTTGEVCVDNIEYTLNEKANVSPAYKVRFQYERKIDSKFAYVYGNVVSNTKLLSKIEVINNYSGKKIIEYSMKYNAPGYYDNNYYIHYRLNSVQLKTAGEKVNPTRILWNSEKHYTGEDDGFKKYELNKVVFNKLPFVGDFNGDGLSDVLVLPYKIQDKYREPVEGEVYINNGDGTFQDKPMTKISFDKNLDWIYVVDLNGDGVDDIIPYEIHNDIEKGKTYVRIKLHLTINGNFINKMVYQYEGGVILMPGSFVNKDKRGVVVIDAYDGKNKGLASYIRYENGGFISSYINNSSVINGKNNNYIAIDVSGDGISEILSLNENGYELYRLYGSGFFTLEFVETGTSMTNAIYPFPNDYNGDGKVDILYYDPAKFWNIILSKGNGFTKPMFCTNNNVLRTIRLNAKDKYRYSLKEMQEPSVAIRTADFDGDGLADVGVFKNMGGNYYLEVGFAPCLRYDNTYTFSTQRRYYMPINYSHQTIILGRFLPQENVAILSSLPRNPLGTEKAYITSLYPNSAYYSVERIIDGMGNSRGFSYDYLIQKKNEKNGFYSCSGDERDGVERKSVPILALKADTVFNINGKPVITNYSYHNALVHRDGHGFLGFEKIITRNYIGNNIVSKQIQEFEMSTMGENCLTLPYCVKQYQGENQLVKERYLSYKKYSCASNNKVVLPLLSADQEVVYDFDKINVPMKNVIVINSYKSDSYAKNLYDDVVQLTLTKKGYDKDITINDPTKCLYCEETYVSYNDDVRKWVVNRPEKVMNCVYDKNGDLVGNIMLFEYDRENPFEVVRELRVPNLMDMNDSLSLDVKYKYDKVGNIIEQTISSPSLECEKVLKYEYGDKYQYRYKTKTLDEMGRMITCEYDGDYGVLMSTTDCNGFSTSVTKDPIGIRDAVVMPDGMKVMKQLCWSRNNKYAPDNATFYIWEKSLGKAETMVFYHKTGAELRTVSFDINGNAVFVDKFYDDYGNLKQESLPYYESQDEMFVSNVYDEYNRLIAEDYPDGRHINYMYDGNEVHTICVTADAKERHRKDTYNIKGWLVETKDNVGNRIGYEYYCDGKIKCAQIGDSRVAVTYDNCRNRSSLYDPNFGLVSYKNDALGNVLKIVNSQSVVEFDYDASGKMVARIEKDLKRNMENIVRWIYNQEEGKSGLLSKIVKSNGHCVEYEYDDKLRMVNVMESINGVKYNTSYSYDEANRLSTIIYPSGVGILKLYSNSGCEDEIYDLKTNVRLWKTERTNANGFITEYKVGNGLETKCLYNPKTSLIERIETIKNDKKLQYLSYEYDMYGNLRKRCDMINCNQEEFEYDSYDRLERIVLNGKEFGHMVYDDKGNIREKEIGGVRILHNAVYDKNKPNAIVRAETDDAGLYERFMSDIEYSSFDNILSVSVNGNFLSMDYGYDNNRIYMEYKTEDKYKNKTYVGNCEFVEENGVNKILTYLEGPMGVFAVCESDENGCVNYVHKDNIGSWNIITDEDGMLLSEMSFDAWGNSRNPISWNEMMMENTLLYDRGFTGHEHLFDFGLINMNGRIYDPLMSMMLSPDNNIQMPQALQNFNRYSYCLNNPLRYNDPTGEWVESLVFGVVGGCSNVVMNAKNIDSFKEGALLFGVGFLQGFLTEFTMGQSWLLQVGVNTVTSGITSGVNQMVAIGNGGFEFSGDDWNSIKTAAFYGLGSGLVDGVMYSYSTPPTEENYGSRLIDLYSNKEMGHSITALMAHGAGCLFSGRSFLNTISLKDFGLDLDMLGCIADRLVRTYVVKSGFADKVIKQRAEEIKDAMLEDVLAEYPDIVDLEYTYQLEGTWIDQGRLYIIGDVFSFFPGEIFDSFPKPYLEEVVSMPFNYSLFRALFFNKQ